MVSLFIFPTGSIALDSEPRGRNTSKIWDTTGTVFIQGPSILLLADGPWIKTVPVVSRIFDVSSSIGLWIEGCRTCWKDELGNHTLGTKAQNMHQLREFLGLNNKPSTSCHCPLLLANGSYALALGRDTKPGHYGLVRADSRRQNLIFFHKP